MKHKSRLTVWYTMVLVAGLALSGCSSISRAVSGTVSALTPSQQTTENSSSRPAESVPAPAPDNNLQKSSILVEGAKAAPAPAPKAANQVDVNLGDNKKCTTFCALPLRKPVPQQ